MFVCQFDGRVKFRSGAVNVWTSHKQFLQMKLSLNQIVNRYKGQTTICGHVFFAEGKIHWPPISCWCGYVDGIDFPGKPFEKQRQS